MPVEVFDMPDVLVKGECVVGEGPVWNQTTKELAWVDIERGEVFQLNSSTGGVTKESLGMMVGAVAFRGNGNGYAVAAADGFGFWEGRELVIVDRILPDSNFRMNDAKCDSRGRFWGGSTHMEFREGMGKLHCWDGSLPSRVVHSGLTLPNGLGWTTNDKTMFLADSRKYVVMRAEFDPDDAWVGEFVPFIWIDYGVPDGLCVDNDNCLWVAIWGGAQLRRYTSEGDLVGVVPMPVTQPSSCAFGDDGVLYITSARSGISEEIVNKNQALAGSVFALQTHTEGIPVSQFAR